jgi:hypothetical protein
MTTLTTAHSSDRVTDSPVAYGESSRCYAIYRHHVQSEIPLPVEPVPPSENPMPDWVIRRASSRSPILDLDLPVVAGIFCEHGSPISLRSDVSDGHWIRISRVGLFHITSDFRCVHVYPDPDVDDQVLGLVLAYQISIFILYRLGYPCIHASAVVTPDGAAVFLGPKGQGKSTIAAAMLRNGTALLTDDALPLRKEGNRIYGVPSLPIMKLWADSATCALALHEELPDLAPGFEKKLVTLDNRQRYADVPAPIRAVYVVSRCEPGTTGGREITVEAVGAREGFAALFRHTSSHTLLRSDEVAPLVALYAQLATQAPVRHLTFPSGFEYQEATCKRVLADLESV